MSQENLATGETAPRTKPRVAVLFGGRSSEHAVSCVTAAGVLGAINKDKYEVIPIGIAKSHCETWRYRWRCRSCDLTGSLVSPTQPK